MDTHHWLLVYSVITNLSSKEINETNVPLSLVLLVKKLQHVKELSLCADFSRKSDAKLIPFFELAKDFADFFKKNIQFLKNLHFLGLTMEF